MNYRHAFHAGNFADLLKHAILLDLLARLQAGPGALTVLDTHAGAGIYDLSDGPSQRSREAEAGIGRLLSAPDAPAVFASLISAVRALSPEGRLYPGSPSLAASALRAGDRYIGCELRADDLAHLKQAVKASPAAQVLQTDGYAAAASRTPEAPARVLVLIDPPFERPDDYEAIARTLRGVLKRNRAAVCAVWLPIKDLETLDAFQRGLSDLKADGAMIETRLRPLSDPMKMNGCAMLLINPPAGAVQAGEAAAVWIAETLGEGGRAVVSPL